MDQIQDYKYPLFSRVLPYKIYDIETSTFDKDSILIVCSDKDELYTPPYHYLMGKGRGETLAELSDKERAYLDVLLWDKLSMNDDYFVHVIADRVVSEPIPLEEVDKRWLGERPPGIQELL